MKKLLTLLLVVLLVSLSVLPVAAQAPVEQVNTSAWIDAAGSPPFVKAAWQWAEGYQVGTEILPNTDEAVPGIGAVTRVCGWAVVSDPNGIGDITDVFFKVYHPDGSFKVQVHMQRLLTAAEWVAAKRLAVNSGQLTTAEAIELDVELEKYDATMWYGCWDYHTHQPAGEYRTEFTVVDQAGNVGNASRFLQVLPVVVLAIDFDTVDFGGIVPNAAKWVMGNDTFSPGDGRPTLWNQGNVNAGVRVHNSAMIGTNYGKEIIDFDVKLRTQTVVYQASTWVDLVGPLLPCTPIQIDFSIHPQYGIPVDDYIGTIDLQIYAL